MMSTPTDWVTPWARWQAAWGRLTRDARDTIWLLGVLALVLAPHVSRLPWWCSLGAAAALTWRGWLAWHDGRLPSRWWLASLLLAAVGLTFLTYHTLIGRQPGVTLVVILTSLKCLELRARRDALVCLYLGFFLVFTQFIYSQGIGTAMLMLVAVWGLITALILGQRPVGRPPLRDVAREAVRAMVWGLPLMLVLFVLFPRIGPLWSLPTDAESRTGLSNELALGEFAQVAQDSSIAMRVRFDGQPPRPAVLYFRGPTLDDFDGRTWRPAAPPVPERARFDGPALRYTLTLEPYTLQSLPLLEGTASARLSAGTTRGGLRQNGIQWARGDAAARRLQVVGQWHAQVQHGPQRSLDLQRWLQLPADSNPRTVAWAKAWKQQPRWQQAAPRALAQGLLAHIRSAGYGYTLAPPPLEGPHLVDAFWLDSRWGFCEHFASSFVVVMRAMGVPARVVTGYQGAELNPVDGEYIVRQSQAHAWAEFWSPGHGWVRVDPTAAVAPERVEQAPVSRPLAGLPGPLGDLDPEVLRRMRAFRDAIDHRWNVWVLQYGQGQQMALLKSMGWPQPDWQALGQTLAVALATIALGGAVVGWATRHRQRPSDWVRSLERVHRALARVAPPPPGASPAPASVWAAHLRQVWIAAPETVPLDAEMLHALTKLDALRYGLAEPSARDQDRQRRALVQQIEALARSRPSPGAH